MQKSDAVALDGLIFSGGLPTLLRKKFNVGSHDWLPG